MTNNLPVPYRPPLPFSAEKVQPEFFSMPLSARLLEKMQPLEKYHMSLSQICEWGLSVAAWSITLRLDGHRPVLRWPKGTFEEIKPLRLHARVFQAEWRVRMLMMPPLLMAQYAQHAAEVVGERTPGDRAMQLIGQSVMHWFIQNAWRMKDYDCTLRACNPMTGKLVPYAKKETG